MPKVTVGRGGWLMIAACLLIGLSPMRANPPQGLLLGALTAASLMLHELGHVLTALCLGVRVHEVGVCVKGPYLRRSRSTNPWSEIAIALNGPMMNALVVMVAWGWGLVGCWLALFNLVLMISNLLPIPGSDGRRIFDTLQAVPQPARRPLRSKDRH